MPQPTFSGKLIFSFYYTSSICQEGIAAKSRGLLLHHGGDFMDMQTELNDISKTTESLTGSLRTWACLDMDALEYNVRRIQSLLPEHCKFMAVVKANAYGHGDIPVARHLAGMGR